MNKNLRQISPQCFGSFVGAGQEYPAIPERQRIEGIR